MFPRSFAENTYVEKCNNFMTAIVDTTRYPASTLFIDVSKYTRFAFLIQLGTLDSTINFRVYQDTSATETGSIKAVTGAVVQVVDANDNKWASIEVEAAKLDIANNFRYVTLVADGGAGSNDYACITFIGIEPDIAPVTQPDNYLTPVVVAG